MVSTPAFPELLRLVEDRSAALRTAVATAPDLRARVPACPDWALSDLLEHVTTVQRFWTAAAATGEGFTPVTPEPDGALAPAAALARSEEVTGGLLKALDEAGPDAPCWTWWPGTGAPGTVAAVARHQVQEAAVHAHDAQQAAGSPRPVPESVAVDGVDEFLTLSWGTADPWPHPPLAVRLRSTEGPSWQVELGPDGPRRVPVGTTALPGDTGTLPGDTDALPPGMLELSGPAGELLLVLHRRRRPGGLRTTGDPTALERLIAWPRLG
ncbi:maleylpyruvate isomerase family mycothiol-dependent enzyme [Kitasatospora sp. NPDC088391]|uniref:maleylpyruvate isomerase family mycothiol-dependent enzyme n=1 Tax=Kitasatospora sp. NPDC088391 TaxID=3364074 RepID=UPI003817B46E